MTTPQSDGLTDLQDHLVGNDFAHFQQRERNEQRARTHSVTLAGENAGARYRKLVLCSQLVTDAEFRVLCLIVEKADADLKNSFASPAWLQRFLGGKSGSKRRRTHKGAENGRRTLRMVYTLIASLERKKFLRWHRGKGWQLCLPPDVLAPGASAWHGPTDWSNREHNRRPA